MKKIYIIGCIIVVLMLALIFVILPFAKDSEKVVDLPFVDKEMENTLINSAIFYEVIDEKEEFTVECLEQLGWLNIGYTGISPIILTFLEFAYAFSSIHCLYNIYCKNLKNNYLCAI